MNRNRRNRAMSLARMFRRGFTLIEIMVVVTIIAILAGIIVPKVWKHVGHARVNVAKAGVQEIAKQVQFYLMDNNLSSVPDGFDLTALTTGEKAYLKPKALKDPWDRPYVLVVPGEVNLGEFDVVCHGADGVQGGEGDNADIVND